MKLTSKGRYAVMAMADLAKMNAKQPTSLSEISLRQGISLSFSLLFAPQTETISQLWQECCQVLDMWLANKKLTTTCTSLGRYKSHPQMEGFWRRYWARWPRQPVCQGRWFSAENRPSKWVSNTNWSLSLNHCKISPKLFTQTCRWRERHPLLEDWLLRFWGIQK